MTMKVTAISLTATVLAAIAGGCGEMDAPPPGDQGTTVTTTSAATGEFRIVMNASTTGIGGNSFNFAANTWPRAGSVVPMGDMTFDAGAFRTSYLVQRGAADLGACASLSDISNWSILASRVIGGFRSGSLPLTVGRCYAIRTLSPVADYGVVRVAAVSSTSVSLSYKYVSTWLRSAYLNARGGLPVSFSYQNQGTSTQPWAGDFRVTSTGNFAADYQEQGMGLIDAGLCNDVSMTHGAFPKTYWPTPNDGFQWGGIKIENSHCYFALTPGNLVYMFLASAMDGPSGAITISYVPNAGKQF